MNALATSGFAVAGAVAGVPVAAVVFAAPTHGAIRMKGRWWRGEPAPPVAVGTTSLLTGTAAGLVTGSLPLSPALPAFWVFAVLAICLAAIDLRQHRLPHAITGTIATVSIGCFTIAAALDRESSSLLRALAAGAIVPFILLMIALALPGQLGLGDVALTGAVALNLGWLSWQAASTGILAALAVQAGAALVLRTRGYKGRTMPMGPAFVVGWLVSVFLAGTPLLFVAS